MGIRQPPEKGSILRCDFNGGFKVPEMVKVRPVVILSPEIQKRKGLCTVVSLSTTEPNPIMPYHAEITLPVPLPNCLSQTAWIKGDMINTVGFHRLDFYRLGKDRSGKRIYYYSLLDKETMNLIHSCVLTGLGMRNLTKYL